MKTKSPSLHWLCLAFDFFLFQRREAAHPQEQRTRNPKGGGTPGTQEQGTGRLRPLTGRKGRILKLLKSKLQHNRENIKSEDIKQVLRSISVSNDLSWQEFKLRFTAVNEKFYSNLKSRCPKLSQGDQKYRPYQIEFFEQGHGQAVGYFGGVRPHHPVPVTKENGAGSER
jgi:hypothetical protein